MTNSFLIPGLWFRAAPIPSMPQPEGPSLASAVPPAVAPSSLPGIASSATPPRGLSLFQAMSESNEAVRSELASSTGHFVRTMEVRYGFYPSDHPFSRYLDGLGLRIANGSVRPRILVTRSWDDINALALPDGTILVSDRLIKFCEYEEELLFVLDHEYQHVIRRHAEKRTALDEKGNDGLDALLTQHAQARLQEYESDLRGHVDLAGRGINPHGATVFFHRLADLEAGKDLAHGSAIDRALNIGLVTRLYDLKVLTRNLTPYPREIREIPSSEELTDYQILVSEAVEEVRGSYTPVRNPQRYIRLEHASLPTLLTALPVLHQRLQDLRNRPIHGHLTQLKMSEDEKVFARLLNRMRGLIDTHFADRSPRERLQIFAAALRLDARIDLFRTIDAADPLYPIAEEWLERLDTRKDFDVLANVLAPEVFGRAGLYVAADPDTFVKEIAQAALEADLFNARTKQRRFQTQAYFDFALSWAKRMKRLSPTLFTDLVLLGIPNLSRKEDLEGYLDAAVAQEIPLDRDSLLRIARQKGFLEMGDEALETALAEILRHIEAKEPAAAVGKLLQAARGRTIEGVSQMLDALIRRHGEESVSVLRSFVMYSNALETIDAFANMAPLERHKWLLSLTASLGLDKDSRGEITDGFWEGYRHAKKNQAIGFEDLGEILRLSRDFDGRHKYFLLTEAVLWNLSELAEEEDKGTFLEAYRREGLDHLIDEVESLSVTDGVDLTAAINQFLNVLFHSYRFDLLDPRDRRFLIEMSYLFESPQLAIRLRDAAIRRSLLETDPRSAFDLLFRDARAHRNTSLQVKEDYVDAKVNLLGDLEELEKAVLDRLDVSPTAGQGRLVLADQLEGALPGKKAIFETLMECREDDRKLKRVLFKIWNVRISAIEGGLDAHDRGYAMVLAERQLEALFGLDPVSIHALVRFLLVGQGGLLRGEKDRRWLLDYFFRHHVDPGGDEAPVMVLLRQGLEALMSEADLETLYFAFAPLIERRILKRPSQSTDWETVLSKGEGSSEMFRAYRALKSGTRDPGDCGLSSLKMPEYERALSALIGDEEGPPAMEIRKVGPVQVVLELASKMGSPGVRFLQILGQFLDIPEDYEEEFEKVYDSLPGQTKLTASMLLKREWPEMAASVAEIDERVGGGSLMTVFRATAADGRPEAIKVLNPNAEYHLEIIDRILEKTLRSLADRHGGGYAAALGALDDIREWIRQDIRFEGFLERDHEFYRQNHGFRPEGSRYAVKVPESRGPENRFFKREEFVEGLNLTQRASLEAQGHDLKAIVSVIVRNYFNQIQSGLMHADVHPGNFRVTADNQVAILDRNFFIELDARDRAFAWELMASLADPRSLAEAVIRYFSVDSPETAASIRDEVETLGGSGLSLIDQLKRLSVLLKRHSIPVPLKITLLIKNANGLHRMARSVGFENLQEAFFL